MCPDAPKHWVDANQRRLMAAVAVVRCHLERYQMQHGAGPHAAHGVPPGEGMDALEQTTPDLPAPSALDTLCGAFHLSPFERDVLLLCAGSELDSRIPSLIAEIHGDPLRSCPTFSLALAAIPEPHWSALSPAAPLRRWRMIDISPGVSLTSSALKIDERILHYLTGLHCMDERLAGLVEKLSPPGILIPSQRALGERIAGLCSRVDGNAPLPVIQLSGHDVAMQFDLAAWACARLGIHLCMIRSRAIPTGPSDLEGFIRLWEREAFLTGSALIIDCHEGDPSDAAVDSALIRLVENIGGMILVASRERIVIERRSSVHFEVKAPLESEQRGLWLSALGETAVRLDGQLDPLISQFRLSPRSIRSACSEVLMAATAKDSDLGAALWDACRIQARPKLGHLAERIEPRAGWDDLVLPEAHKEILKEIATHVRKRSKVYDGWGFSGKSARGLGISALFAGASGTGKTMAAEVLAGELRLDLFRIDLSQVVNKYIGETEKNLKRVFDAAEAGGAILLFDEADALFGKRTEVRDSHDRYANIEVSYLLQRMESYRGLAILTTNMKDALDASFLRRIRFIVQFPFPDHAQRAEIWRRIFPVETPTGVLDADRLSRLHVAGGNIRNIALHAAFLAAEGNEAVNMTHIQQAVKREYAKIEKPLSVAEMDTFRVE